MGEEQFGSAPSLPAVGGTREHQISIGVRMRDASLAKGPPFRGSAKRHNQFALAPRDDGWKSAIELVMGVDRDVAQLANRRSCFRGLVFGRVARQGDVSQCKEQQDEQMHELWMPGRDCCG